MLAELPAAVRFRAGSRIVKNGTQEMTDVRDTDTDRFPKQDCISQRLPPRYLADEGEQ